MFRGVLLDLDDTLFDRAAAFERWALGRGCATHQLAALHAIDRRGHRSRAEFAAEAARLGLIASIDPERFPFELADHIEPEPQVRDTLEALAHTRKLAIVTNGGPAQRVKLAKLGLDGVAQAVFVSGEVGLAKPDPAIFERALAWSQLAPADVIFVGDEPTIDLAPAAALGMATAWRARAEWPDTLPPPTFRIDRIAQLGEVCA